MQALSTQTVFGMPRRNANGIDYNRVALLIAVLEKKAGLMLGNQDVYLNVVGGIKANEPALDLGIVLAAASSFKNAELEVVPAFKADDIGFDRGLIGSYGHDDRVCAYPAEQAIFSIENPDYTAITVLTDKEETGSDGNTGLQSSYLVYFINDLAKANGLEGFQVLSKSECLSADVNSAYDPTFNSVFEKNNTSYLNKGVVITKYTGARGKSGTSDASAEYVASVRSMLEKAGFKLLDVFGEMTFEAPKADSQRNIYIAEKMAIHICYHRKLLCSNN